MVLPEIKFVMVSGVRFQVSAKPRVRFLGQAHASATKSVSLIEQENYSETEH